MGRREGEKNCGFVADRFSRGHVRQPRWSKCSRGLQQALDQELLKRFEAQGPCPTEDRRFLTGPALAGGIDEALGLLEPACSDDRPGSTGSRGPPLASKLDPVCGMTVKAEPAAPERRAEHGGEAHWFCGAGCQRKFVADPARYLKPKAPTPVASVVDERLNTCPMHPEIQQRGPGSCPICGMALEPSEVTENEGPEPGARSICPDGSG